MTTFDYSDRLTLLVIYGYTYGYGLSYRHDLDARFGPRI